MKKLTLVGLLITTLWLGAFAAVLISNWSSASKLSLNEWGDFLAGITAPLALIWIVIGYFLQGEELRLNTRALEAQHDELKRQVNETAILAKNSERQAIAAEQLAYVSKSETERAALRALAEVQPIFRSLRRGSESPAQYRTWITNVGAAVKNLSIRTDNPNISLSLNPNDVFEHEREVKLRADGVTKFPFDFSIEYEDMVGNRHTKNFQMTHPHDFREI